MIAHLSDGLFSAAQSVKHLCGVSTTTVHQPTSGVEQDTLHRGSMVEGAGGLSRAHVKDSDSVIVRSGADQTAVHCG